MVCMQYMWSFRLPFQVRPSHYISIFNIVVMDKAAAVVREVINTQIRRAILLVPTLGLIIHWRSFNLVVT